MIQVSDSSELKGKATKGSLADWAEKEASRLERHQLWSVIGTLLIVIGTALLGKLGWYLLPVVVACALTYSWLDRKIADLRGRSVTYKKLKAVHSKRPFG